MNDGSVGLDDLRPRIDIALIELRQCLVDPVKVARLAPIELLIAQDVVSENRHLRCAGCLRWIQALTDKANGLTPK